MTIAFNAQKNFFNEFEKEVYLKFPNKNDQMVGAGVLQYDQFWVVFPMLAHVHGHGSESLNCNAGHQEVNMHHIIGKP